VLDVGSGWGYFCSKVNKDTGASCTGITLSREQIAYCEERYKDQLCKTKGQKAGDHSAGKSGCIEFIFQDYRDGMGSNRFDRVSSVGMIEHVGHKRVEEYLGSSARSLKPGGFMLIHGITVTDIYPKYGDVSRSTACQQANFVSKHIFPGGCLQHVDWINEAAYNVGVTLMHQESFGKHYYPTLVGWYDNMVKNWHQVSGKYDDRVFRTYEFFWAFSAAAFRISRLDLTQFVFYKSNAQGTMYEESVSWIKLIQNPNQNPTRRLP
jgi:cyclopropane-fatty-acyl-phospholipid synthase